jgi:hypothetical protein
MADLHSSSGFDIQSFIRDEPKLSALNSLVQAVEDADSFVQDLPEVSYEVSKTLHGWVGKKVTRRLKLTMVGIANLRRSGATSSLYEYDRIIKVTMSNINTLVIEYKGAKHPYTYSAPNALEIAHEIQTRMKFFNAAMKKRMTLRLATPYLEVLEGMRAARLQQGGPSPRNETILDSRISRSTISRAQARTIGDAKSLKLTSLINTILLDKRYEEAKVLKGFLDGFDSVEKNAKTCVETTRQFLTSLKERVMEVRYDSLLNHAPDFNAQIETQADVIGREVELCIEKFAILKLHDRLLDVLSKINKKDDQKIEQQIDKLVSKPQSYFGIPSGLEATSKWQLAVIEINEIASLFLPQEKLRAILNCIAAIVDTAQFESDRRAKENGKLGSMSPSMSSSAISTPSSAASSISPSQSPSPNTSSSNAQANKGQEAIAQDQATAAFQSIALNPAHAEGMGRAASPNPPASKPVDLSADDLLPILIYVLVHSKLSRLETQCQYMWQMSDPADLVGESGYYLTMLSSAVEYLKQHEEEVSVPPSSQPVSISGSSSAGSINSHNANILFDDSDSEEEMSPSSSSSATPAPGSWIGSKSFLASNAGRSASASVTPSSSTSGTPSSPTDLSATTTSSAPSSSTTRPNRQSIFVIGSTRSQPPSYFAAVASGGVPHCPSSPSPGSHRSINNSDAGPSTGNSSMLSDLDSGSPTSHGPPCDMLTSSSLNSNPSISSTPTTGLSPSLTLQRSPPSSPR